MADLLLQNHISQHVAFAQRQIWYQRTTVGFHRQGIQWKAFEYSLRHYKCPMDTIIQNGCLSRMLNDISETVSAAGRHFHIKVQFLLLRNHLTW